MLVKDLLGKYFHEGFRYKEIIALLKNRHGIKFSLRTLHRCLRRANFYRKGKQSPLLDIVTFIQHEFEGTGSFFFFFFFSIWVFFHDHSRITGLQGKGESISLTPHYHFHPLHRHLDISRAITAESSPLHIASSRTRTGNLWFPRASR